MAEGHPALSNVDRVHIRWTHVPTQIGFVGHEAGHHQISASRQANDVIGLLYGDLAIGLSFGWWVDKHNRHHAHPNQEGRDPDIQTGALAFTAGKAGSVLRDEPFHRVTAEAGAGAGPGRAARRVHRQVPVRVCRVDMTEVGGQQRQPGLNVDAAMSLGE